MQACVLAHAHTQTLGELGRFFQHRNPLARQQGLEWQVRRAVHPAGNLLVKRPTGQLRQYGDQIVLRHGSALAAQPQGPHHRIQVGFTFLTQGQVKTQGHQRPFGVITYRCIGRVFVRPVVFHPGIKAGLRHALQGPPRRLQNLVDGFGE